MDCSFIGWCDLSEEAQAAWAQGVFSVLGIAVAILIPALQHKSATKQRAVEKRLQARSLSMSLMADFQVVLDRLNDVWGYEHQDSLPEETGPMGPMTRDAIDLPPKLSAMADRLHDMGPAGDAAQRCIYNIRRAREFVTHNDFGEPVVFDRKPFYDHLWDATGAAMSVLNHIDVMFR